LTRLRTNLLELQHHAGFAKVSRWITKIRHSKYSFALSIHSFVRTMGAIRWGARGTRPPHFFRKWGYNLPCSPHFSL